MIGVMKRVATSTFALPIVFHFAIPRAAILGIEESVGVPIPITAICQSKEDGNLRCRSIGALGADSAFPSTYFTLSSLRDNCLFLT